MKTSSSPDPESPVGEQDLKDRLDEIFSGNASRFDRLKHTARQVVKHGLDYRDGNPLRSTFYHLAHLVDRRLDVWREKEILPKSFKEKDLEAWGKKVEAWGERVNQREKEKRRSRKKKR
ncbi:MAG: hypothetical protein AAF804_13440 [Bacteroidota bacterium]